jgi:hypothetical protein
MGYDSSKFNDLNINNMCSKLKKDVTDKTLEEINQLKKENERMRKQHFILIKKQAEATEELLKHLKKLEDKN